MRKMFITILMLFVCTSLVAPAALADNVKYISFTYNGQTYTLTYDIATGIFIDDPNGVKPQGYNPEWNIFDNFPATYDANYKGYLAASRAAQDSFLRSHNGGDLGDNSIPIWALCASAACFACLALFVHGKRRSFCSASR